MGSQIGGFKRDYPIVFWSVVVIIVSLLAIPIILLIPLIIFIILFGFARSKIKKTGHMVEEISKQQELLRQQLPDQ